MLGKGGYGMVFLATRNSDGAKVALKYITCRTDYERQLAQKEFEVIMKARHPNIVPILDIFLNWQEQVDYGGVGGSRSHKAREGSGFHGTLDPFDASDLDATVALTRPRYVAIVSPFFQEGDLKKFCFRLKRQKRRLEEPRVLSIMAQLITTIVFLHDQKQQIVHRDLKPENILLDYGARKAVITDFGLAFNNTEEASHMTTQAGSLPFVAPECWTKHYNWKVDIWSLGCVLYAMLTNRVTANDARVMFNDVDDADFEAQIFEEVVTIGGYSKESFALLMKMLQKDPFQRPNAHDVEIGIRALLLNATGCDGDEHVTWTRERTEEGLRREHDEKVKAEEHRRKLVEENAERKRRREERSRRRQREQQQLLDHVPTEEIAENGAATTADGSNTIN
jgi:serine/threonine-protein kinase PDIK1L